MARSEKLILIRDTHPAVLEGLDAILTNQGYARTATQTLAEDFSPLLHEEGGPLVFVLSPLRDEWLACFSSLAVVAEWELAEQLAVGLEQPLVYALFDAARDVCLYRYFERGELLEEALAGAETSIPLDEAMLLQKLQAHGIPVELVDDRTTAFGEEHLVLGYQRSSSAIGDGNSV